MQFYIILPFLIVLFKSNVQRLSLLFALFFISCGLNLFFSNPLITWSIISYLYLFFLGWAISTYQDKIGFFLAKRGALISIAFLFVGALFYKGVRFDNMVKIYEVLTSTAFALILAGTAFKYSESRNKIVIALSFVGRSSFSIYLYNYIFWFFNRDGLTSTSKLATVIFVIAFGTMMHFLIEKNTEKLRRAIMDRLHECSSNMVRPSV